MTVHLLTILTHFSHYQYVLCNDVINTFASCALLLIIILLCLMSVSCLVGRLVGWLVCQSVG